ncbi:MAG: hypothetical protein PWQ55_2204 [Chloroflexota bacterium]|nr:hypothetical protein [Chloroflexota bacterium]
MFALSANDFVLTLAGIVLALGVIAFIVGLFTLAFRVSSGDFNEITASSAKLAEKGLTDDVSDLVNGISEVLKSITEMTKTKVGVGIFLIFVSFVLFVVAYYLVSRVV